MIAIERMRGFTLGRFVFWGMCDCLFRLRLAIVVPPAIQSKKERPRLIASSKARQSPNNSNKPGRKIRSEPLHCCSIKLAVLLDGAIQPRKIWDYVRIKLSHFVPCTSCSGVDGYAKLPCNILHRGAFFNYRTFFSGKLILPRYCGTASLRQSQSGNQPSQPSTGCEGRCIM